MYLGYYWMSQAQNKPEGINKRQGLESVNQILLCQMVISKLSKCEDCFENGFSNLGLNDPGLHLVSRKYWQQHPSTTQPPFSAMFFSVPKTFGRGSRCCYRCFLVAARLPLE